MKKMFFRYESVEYAIIGRDGDAEISLFPNPKVELRIFYLFKETNKGYWITYNDSKNNLRGDKWVSKTSKKRYAYPTKKEALDNFINRTKSRIMILKRQLWSCEISVSEAMGIKC